MSFTGKYNGSPWVLRPGHGRHNELSSSSASRRRLFGSYCRLSLERFSARILHSSAAPLPEAGKCVSPFSLMPKFQKSCSSLKFTILLGEDWAKQISSAVLDVDGLLGLSTDGGFATASTAHSTLKPRCRGLPPSSCQRPAHLWWARKSRT